MIHYSRLRQRSQKILAGILAAAVIVSETPGNDEPTETNHIEEAEEEFL